MPVLDNARPQHIYALPTGTGRVVAALDGTLVIDLTTLLPGPLATLLLAEAGARVVKVERPPVGDEMRTYVPRFGASSANFALLNRGKESLVLDLKDEDGRRRLCRLLEEADVLVEQFRPGVMARLGLGYEQVRQINPRIVYCSITGYGQHGPRAGTAGHDLNYVSDAGLLSLVTGGDGGPVLPPALIADIGGGAYPAVMNILLALHERDRTGTGRHLDVAMTDNVFPLLYWALAEGFSAGEWPDPDGGLVTGLSPRYGLYPTADGGVLAVAALEDRFWSRLCDIVGLDRQERRDELHPERTRRSLAERIAAEPTQYWRAALEGEDVCVSVVRSVEEAVADPQFRARGLFDREVSDEPGSDRTIPALPVPLDPGLRRSEQRLPYPRLGIPEDGSPGDG